MPLRDRKSSVKPKTSETLAQLEQQVQAIGKQLSERFDLLQVPQQQEVDKKTARQAVEYEREYEMVVLPFRHWDPSAIINAKSMADEGDLELCADLWESALADDRVASAMEQRINGLEGLPVRFTGDGEDVLEAISTDFWQMMKPGDRALTRRWAYGVGICPVYATEIVENGDGRQILILEPWSPRFLRWRQGAALGKREWWIQTARGQIRLADQPGRWFLFTPFSGSNQRPWVDGLWYSTATWFLAKSFGIADLASFSQSHATPKWFLMPKEGAQISGPEKAEAIRRLAALPQRSGMYIPSGFTVEQKETTSAAWNAITALIELANKALTVRIIGTDSTTDKESSFASTAGGMQLLYVKFRTDADAESAFWHDGPLQFWYLLNFRGARKLQDRRVLDLEADPITGEYRFLDESGRRQKGKSAYGQQLRQLSEQIRGGDEVPWPTRDATPPEDMAAVAETQFKAAGTLVQLTTAGATDPEMAAAIARIDKVELLARYFPMKDAADITGVSSTPAAPAPEGEGQATKPVAALHGNQIDAAMGIITQVASGTVPRETGLAMLRQFFGMTTATAEELMGSAGKAKPAKTDEKPQAEISAQLQDRCPTLLLQSSRNIRAPLHEGLEFVDETVGAMSAANPVAMDDITGQILRVLTDAKDYSDARKRLQDAFPTMDRSQLRDMLTGGMLIAQAAGMESVQREAK